MEYNRGRMKQEVRQIMRETRPRPIWVTLFYLFIVAVGTWLIQSVIGAILGVGALSSSLTGLIESLDSYTNMDPEALGEMLAGLLLSGGGLIAGLAAGSIVISILSYLWTGTMAAGYVNYSIRMVRRQNPGVGDVFSGFTRFGRVLLTNILVYIFTILWSLLFGVIFAVVAIVAALLIAMEGAGLFVGVVLFVVAYVALLASMLWLSYRFALTNHLVMDQGISGLEALTVSKRLMRGNKWRMFVLHLSFIGWYLLMFAAVVICAVVIGVGVGLIMSGSMGGIAGGVILILVMVLVLLVVMALFGMWLQPYQAGAVAKFYEYTMSRRPDMFEKTPDQTDSFGHPEFPTLD